MSNREDVSQRAVGYRLFFYFLATRPYRRRRSANPCSQSLRTSEGNLGACSDLVRFRSYRAGRRSLDSVPTPSYFGGANRPVDYCYAPTCALAGVAAQNSQP